MSGGRGGSNGGVAAAAATLLFVLSAGLAGLALFFLFRGDGADVLTRPGDAITLGVMAVVAVAVSGLSALAIAAEPRSSSGWIFGTIGLLLAAKAFAPLYVAYAQVPAAGNVRGVDAATVADRIAIPAIVLAVPFVLLLAPQRPRSRGYRALTAIAIVAAAASLVLVALAPGPIAVRSLAENPIAAQALEPYASAARLAWIPVVLATAAVAAVSLALRPRGSEERRRLRWRRRREEAKSAWHFLRDLPRVFPYLRPYWKLGIASFTMIGFGALVGLLAPWPLAILIDTVLGNKPLPSILGSLFDGWDRTTLLVFAVVAGLVLTALENGLGVLDNYINVRLEQRMVLDLRSDLFRHAHRLSQNFHDKTRTGMLMYQINNQAASVGSVTVAIPPLIQSVAMLVGMFVIAYRIDPQLALLSLTVVPFIYYSTGFYATRIEPRLMYVRGLEGQSLSIVHEAMAMLRVIVSFGRERYEYGRFRTQADEAVGARIDLSVRQTAFSLGVNVITAAGTALVLGFGGWHVMQAQLTVGELLVVMAYIAAVYQPLQDISSTMTSLQEQFIGLRHALNLLDEKPEVEEPPDAITLEKAEGGVRFENVSFDYPGREATLANISFDALPGQHVGIVGPTGAGKTTLVSLIPRFYDPKEGRVLVDGIDLKNLTLDSLRAQISVVHQEPMLFSGTIAENIRYGRLEATEGEMEAAARAANAHEFIERLPNGYATDLGEGGPQLSGGERQRIAVARAFIKDAPILILDEPTASIDSKTEAVILDALDRLMEGRTTFVVAHRLSTLRSVDLILVMNEGEVVERGTHEELLARGGLYRQLYDAQTGQRRLRVVEEDAGARAEEAAPSQARGADRSSLVEALKVLMNAPADDLNGLALDRGQPLEIRLAAGVLAALTREELGRLRDLDDARLASFLEAVRPR